jgi:acetyl esterase/lipase
VNSTRQPRFDVLLVQDLPRVSYCRVDADGVPAEWVEATPAAEGQATFVYFQCGGCGGDPFEESRRPTGDLAVSTGARVLEVACLSGGTLSPTSPVERGVAAYAWLLGEGCDVDSTAFTHEAGAAALADAILLAARNRGLPVPALGICPPALFASITAG